LYRGEVVRSRDPFFATGRLHEDSELCFEVLHDWDFGFVHKVLSFVRVASDSILGRLDSYHWRALDNYLTMRMFGPRYLSAAEYDTYRAPVERRYYSAIAEHLLFLREQEVWDYHRKGLATIGERLPSGKALPHLFRNVAKAVIRPGWTRSILARRRRAICDRQLSFG